MSGEEKELPPLPEIGVCGSGLGYDIKICICNKFLGGISAVGLRTTEIRRFEFYHLNKLRALPANEKGRENVGAETSGQKATQALYGTNDVC